MPKKISVDHATTNYTLIKDPSVITIKVSDESMTELKAIAQELGTDVAGALNKAYYLFRLVQGKQIILKENGQADIEVSDFINTTKRI